MNPITMRPAQREDVSAIIHLLADDPIGQTRENMEHPLSHAYLHAFDAMAQDARSLLAVATLADDIIIGCLHLTFIPGLSHHAPIPRISRTLRHASLGDSSIALHAPFSLFSSNAVPSLVFAKTLVMR